ncbi:PAS domain S-box protein [bacterium]|nr:PAS domain S-box protein [bacterium]
MKKASKQKIVYKILWPFVVIFAILIIAFMASISDFIDRKTKTILQKEAESRLKMAELYLDAKRDQILAEMRHLSRILALNLSEQNQPAFISGILECFEGVTDKYFIQMLDANGVVIEGAWHLKKDGISETEKPDFDIHSTSENSLITERIFIRLCDNDVAIEVIVPIENESQTVGYIYSRNHLTSGFCVDMSKAIGGRVYFFGRDNRIITLSCSTDPDFKDIILPEEIAQRVMEKRGPIVRMVYIGDKEHVSGFLPFENQGNQVEGVLMLPIDAAFARGITVGVIRTGIIYGCGGIIVLVFIGWMIAKGITKPLSDLADMAKRVGAGNLDASVELDSDDEIGVLAAAFRKMTNDLKQSTVSKEYVDNILKSMSDALMVIGQDGRIETVNRSACELLGYKQEELVSRPFENIIFEKKGSGFGGLDLERLTGQGEIKNLEMEYITRHGKRVPVILSASVIKTPDNKVKHIVCTAKDITERKQAEDALVSEKERLDVTLRSICDGVIATDMGGKIVLMNRVAEELTGWKLKEAEGKPVTSIFNIMRNDGQNTHEDPVKEILGYGGAIVHHDHSLLKSADGKARIIADSGATIKDKAGKTIGVILVFQDITEKKRLEEDIQKTQKLESVGVLAGGIAHDFNNILTAILGNISLAMMYAGSDGDISKVLAEAEKASVRAKGLTKQLITFSKGGAPVKEAASIPEIIKESVEFALRGSNVKPEFFLPDDLLQAEIDKGQIGQAVNNLVINAIQAMPDGGKITIKAENIYIDKDDKVPHRSLRVGKYIKITFEDEGIGIPKENLKKIFDPYFSTKQMGSGLGLSVVYSIIKKHNGHIAAKSEQGKGTAFYVYLPACQNEALNKEPKTFSRQRVSKGKARVLIMDDDEPIRDILGKMLMHLGHEKIDFARDGEEAIELYKKAKRAGVAYDVVIMDLTIPGGMGGKEAIKRLLEIDPDVKAIVSSGYSNDPAMNSYREYGFSSVIGKPYKIEELNDAIDRVMAESPKCAALSCAESSRDLS